MFSSLPRKRKTDIAVSESAAGSRLVQSGAQKTCRCNSKLMCIQYKREELVQIKVVTGACRSVPSLEDTLLVGAEAETAEKLYRCRGASGCSGGLVEEVPGYRGG